MIAKKSKLNLKNKLDEVFTKGHILLEKHKENEHSTESNQTEIDIFVGLVGANGSLIYFKFNSDNNSKNESEVLVDVHIRKVDGIATMRFSKWQSYLCNDYEFVDVHSNHGSNLSLKDKACPNGLEIPTIVDVVEGQGIHRYPRHA